MTNCYGFCVCCDTLVVVWLNFGVCMYLYEDSNFGSFRIAYVYAYDHTWLKHQVCKATITKLQVHEQSAIYISVAFDSCYVMNASLH